MEYRMRVTAVLLAASCVAACGAGEGGRINVPCDEVRCDAECRAGGAESGECREDRCVCVQPLDIPGGLSTGFSAGGLVHRTGGGHQLSITIGPVSVGGTALRGTQDLETGFQPTTDPERLRQADAGTDAAAD